MENKLKILFKNEKIDMELDIANPDLAELIHRIVEEKLDMTKENVEITTEVEGFDADELLDIMVNVHEEFCEEIETFYRNIKNDITTYYDDEVLGEEIIRRIKEDMSKENVSE